VSAFGGVVLQAFLEEGLGGYSDHLSLFQEFGGGIEAGHVDNEVAFMRFLQFLAQLFRPIFLRDVEEFEGEFGEILLIESRVFQIVLIDDIDFEIGLLLDLALVLQCCIIPRYIEIDGRQWVLSFLD
jgi:hypothetical protein